uniref:Uncharacterized protein n=1 Tax=Caenorhabditis japonica TaxID=281687 RepID=A0A8R1I5B8_CAEJA
MSEKESGVTSNETPARVVAAMSQSSGKASAVPQEGIIVASQSNVAPERNAQHLSINVIVKSDSQQAAAAANKRGTTRSSSPNRRITRAMSASQQPRVNVFAMKVCRHDPNFSGTSKENFHAFVRNFKDHISPATGSIRPQSRRIVERNNRLPSSPVRKPIRKQLQPRKPDGSSRRAK